MKKLICILGIASMFTFTAHGAFWGASETNVAKIARKMVRSEQSTNTHLGIGTTTPVANLDVPGTAAIGALTASNLIPTTIFTATNYTSTTNDSLVLYNATSGPLTNTLPDATAAGAKLVTIKKVDASTNLVIINPVSSQTIDGISVWALSYKDQFVTLGSSGTNWFIASQSPEFDAYSLNLDIGLEEWHAALAAIKSRTNGGVEVNVVMIGDSITEGSGSGADGGTKYTNSHVGKLRAEFQSDFVANGIGFIGCWRTATHAPFNILQTGTWASGTPSALAGGGPWNRTLRPSGTTSNWLEITNVQTVAGFYIYHHENVFTVTGTNIVELVDAAETNVIGTIVTASSATANYKRQYFATNMTSAVTVRIRALTANDIFFDGIQLCESTNGVFVHNIGWAGKKVDEYVAGEDWSNTLSWAVSTMSPKLTIIELDSNDSFADTTPATYRTNLANIITFARRTGSVLVVGSNTRSDASAGVQENLHNIGRELALKHKCGYVSIKRMWGDNARQVALGMVSDGVHPLLAGHQRKKDYIYRILTP